jgi:hypothetical protein
MLHVVSAFPTCTGLIQKHQLRATQQRQCHTEAALHATRVGAAALACCWCQLHLLKQLAALLSDLQQTAAVVLVSAAVYSWVQSMQVLFMVCAVCA